MESCAWCYLHRLKSTLVSNGSLHIRINSPMRKLILQTIYKRNIFGRKLEQVDLRGSPECGHFVCRFMSLCCVWLDLDIAGTAVQMWLLWFWSIGRPCAIFRSWLLASIGVGLLNVSFMLLCNSRQCPIYVEYNLVKVLFIFVVYGYFCNGMHI